jgi:hypothetical protein
MKINESFLGSGGECRGTTFKRHIAGRAEIMDVSRYPEKMNVLCLLQRLAHTKFVSLGAY